MMMMPHQMYNQNDPQAAAQAQMMAQQAVQMQQMAQYNGGNGPEGQQNQQYPMFMYAPYMPQGFPFQQQTSVGKKKDDGKDDDKAE